MVIAVVVLGAGATARSFTRHRAWGSLAAALAGAASITLLFAPGSAILGVVPTFATFDELHELEVAGTQSITNQALPAQADAGIVYLLCLGVAAICVALDLLVLTLRMPALAGLPLLVLLLVPSIVDPTLDDGLFFALTAAAYVGLLLVRSRPSTRAAGAGVAAVAVVFALVVPLVLPTVTPAAETGRGPQGAATGVNPILDLGEDLRRGDPSLALTYVTSESDGIYTRLTALDDFDGDAWKPSTTEPIPGNEVDAIGAAPGLGADVRTSEATSDITIGDITSRWLPVPYAATSIAGLDGTWNWEPDALSIRTDRSNARGQEYTVSSLTILPSIDQLMAAGTVVAPGLERYLVVPDDLPAVVAQTALDVVGAATTNYEKALALQGYFRSDLFTYSEQAPVENDYDGSGAGVLGEFLDAKSGYCVHFSSAMAAMARTLGIPARVIVGFTAGDATAVGGDTEFRVTTHNLHAWPELYFEGIGWVRFEPTPGRGSPPEFAPLSVDDPATPDVDESVPVPTTTDAATPTTAPTRPPEDEPAPTESPVAGEGAAATPLPWWSSVLAALLALLLAPAVVRLARRGRRVARASAGSATAAWDELRDTADDLGLATTANRTPRQLASDLAPHLDQRGTAALARLRAVLESEAFADRPGFPNPGDISSVLWSLRRKAGPVRTLVAALLPRSLFARWLPEAFRPAP